MHAHQLDVHACGKSMKTKDPLQITNNDMTQHHMWKGIADNFSRNKWMLVDSEYVNIRSKEESFVPDIAWSFSVVTARRCDRIVTSGHGQLPFALISSSFDDNMMSALPYDNKPMIVL
jgi:hypothetical protein